MENESARSRGLHKSPDIGMSGHAVLDSSFMAFQGGRDVSGFETALILRRCWTGHNRLVLRVKVAVIRLLPMANNHKLLCLKHPENELNNQR
jgi:hypothetical protein